MKIVLVCSGGMSTSLVVESMRKEASARALACRIEAIPLTSLREALTGASCVLVAPQVRHRLKGVQEMSAPSNTPVGVIDAAAYGRIDGKAVLNQALSLIGSPTDGRAA